MYVLIVTRKGDLQEVIVGITAAALQQRGDALEGSPLPWQSGWAGGLGSHSPSDEEKSYEIVKASV